MIPRIRLTFWLVICLLAVSQAAIAAPPTPARSPVNPVLARTYNRLAEGDLNEDSLNIEPAMAKLKALAVKDGGNALRHYLLAAAYSATDQWDLVQSSLDAGHRAPYCINYQLTDGPLRLMPTSVVIRQFCRRLLAATPAMEKTKAASLLQAVRKMGKQLLGMEPYDLLHTLIGLSVRGFGDKGLVEIYPADTPEGDAARKVQQTDIAFRDRVIASVKALTSEDLSGQLAALIEKHQIAEEDMIAFANGEKVPSDVQIRLRRAAKELNAVQRPVITKWLKLWPE